MAARKTGSIVLYDYQNGEVARYNFTNGVGRSKVDDRRAKAGANEVTHRGGHDRLRRARAGEVTLAVATRRRHRPQPRHRTEFPFALPRGYVDDVGHGAPRRRHAPGDGARRDPAAARSARPRERGVPDGACCWRGSSPGSARCQQVTNGVIEGLFASDLAFLQDLYRRVNQEGHTQAAVTCPACQHDFTVDLSGERRGNRDVRDRPALRGGRVRRLPLPLAVRRDPRPRASGSPALRRGDRPDQRTH